MSLKKKKCIGICALLLWMGFIFFMSSNNGDESTKQSDTIIKLLDFLGINFSNTFAEFASVIVRKGAHFTEYMILCGLFINVFNVYKLTKGQIIKYSILGVFLYACSDEIHQLFVPGRAGRIQDVLIDTSGGVFAIIIFTVVNLSNFKKKKINAL